MNKRGRVLRDPSPSGPGLVIVEGQQFSFSLDGAWRSLTLPKPGLDVEVELSPDGTVSSLVAIPETQLAREQAERTLNAARESASALAASAVAKFGVSTLAATGALVLGWFFLNALTYDAGLMGKLDFTFWRVLEFLNSSNGLGDALSMRDWGGAGVYGLLAWLALAGPYAGALWADKRAALGGVLPLAFLGLVAAMARARLVSDVGGVPAEVMDAAQVEIQRGVSVGAGAYLSLLAAAYLAFNGVKRFLAAGSGVS
ncbi:hypothetical protein DYQ86_04525 [Acidobacteria bacterium AB60]|nr:hypothetical protein DYQ86_04525 [Acidobacteria bacterium AB60]